MENENSIPINSNNVFDNIEIKTKDELDAKIQAGLDDIAAGRVRPAKEAFKDKQKKFRKQ